MATSWEELISSTTEAAKPPEDVLQAAVKFLTDVAKLPDPNAASGVTEADVDKCTLPELLPAAALIRRLVRHIEALDKARMAQATAKTALANVLASALAPAKAPDVADMLQKCGLSKLGFHVQADQSLYVALQLASEEAKAQSRTPFTYVDFTSKEVLPLWLPADSGKFTLRDDDESRLAGHHAIGSLSDLSKALKGATASPRFFRNVQQWVAAFVRYATTAVATGQMTWPVVFGHLDVVLQEKIKGRAAYLAFLYDDLVRRQWARRAEKRDPSLDILAESQKVDKDMLELARQRVSSWLLLSKLRRGLKQPVRSWAKFRRSSWQKLQRQQEADSQETLPRGSVRTMNWFSKQANRRQQQQDKRGGQR